MQYTTSLNFAPSLKKNGVFEPMSVLDTRSPSPSTSTSTLSSSLGGTNGGGAQPPAAAAGGGDILKEEWPVDLQGLCNQGAEKFGVEDWDSILSESTVGIQDQSLMRWNFSDDLQGGGDIFPGFEMAGGKVDVSPNNGVHQNPIFVQNSAHAVPFGGFEMEPQPKRQNLGFFQMPGSEMNTMMMNQQRLYLDLGQQQMREPQMRKPLLVPKQEVPDGSFFVRRQQVYDHLFKASEMILPGNYHHAQSILARLNHQLSPAVHPLQRIALHFKDALEALLFAPNRGMFSKVPGPLEGIFKMGAYKMFSEVSPMIHFMNFTSNQALIEALDGAESIHIIDFDIGCGAQWSSFMHELPKKCRGSPRLKITAFASPSAYNAVEISLMHEGLSHFANDLGIKFELEVVNFDSFDPSTYPVSSIRSSMNDTIAVNFPLWSIASRPAVLPSLICFIKQLSPKLVVMLGQGCERFELPPSHHFLNALQYYEVLMESVDAAHMPPDSASKIEKFLIQPKIESIVFGRMQCPNQIPPAVNVLTATGFSPVPLSNFAETQAECVVKRTQIRGFHVEKRQSSLVLCWQHRELMSASVWKC